MLKLGREELAQRVEASLMGNSQRFIKLIRLVLGTLGNSWELRTETVREESEEGNSLG